MPKGLSRRFVIGIASAVFQTTPTFQAFAGAVVTVLSTVVARLWDIPLPASVALGLMTAVAVIAVVKEVAELARAYEATLQPPATPGRTEVSATDLTYTIVEALRRWTDDT